MKLSAASVGADILVTNTNAAKNVTDARTGKSDMLSGQRSNRLSPVVRFAFAAILQLCLTGPQIAAAQRESVLMAEAAEAFSRGQTEAAVAGWRDAASIYRALGENAGYCDALQNMGLGYQSLGQIRLARQAFASALSVARDLKDDYRICSINANLGSCLTLSGDASEADSYFAAALQMARQIHEVSLEAAILNDLGIRYSVLDDQKSIECFLKSAELADDPMLRAKANVNAARELLRQGDYVQAIERNHLARIDTSSLPDTSQKASLLIGIGRNAQAADLPDESFAALDQAIRLSTRIGSDRDACYAWGSLGELYEHNRRLDDAMLCTRRAVFLSQKLQSPDALYRWEWQMGRLFRTKGDFAEAIGAYGRAVQAVGSIRHDISLAYGTRSAVNGFRQTAGPIFYQLADVLLHEARAQSNSALAQRYLRRACDTIEQLKGAELEDYFQEDCINLLKSRQRSIDDLLPEGTAVVYIIPLDDRIELLMSCRGKLQQFVTADISRDQLARTATALRSRLEDWQSDKWRAEARCLYEWVIAPMEATLQSEQIDTLVFVPDGELRAIPMAALLDAQGRFLVSRYATAVSPGLTLTAAPATQGPGATAALAAGVFKASPKFPEFPALPSVESELNDFERLFSAFVLCNEQFVRQNLRKEFNQTSPNILHLATHAQFRAEASQSFLMMWDEKLSLNDLQQLISPSQFRGKPLDLICLSGCETAAGDDSARAALGLGGVAVKSGARTALATLWSVDDKASSILATRFYEQLRRSASMSKAQALRQAQLEQMKDPRFEHPSSWAPYLLIGNWQ